MTIKVDQISDNEWAVKIIGTKLQYFFNTVTEAMDMANKLEYAQDMQQFMTDLAGLFRDAPDLEGVYFDRGYNGGGSDPIVDGDVSGLGITAADIASGITLVQQLQNFANNSAVTTGDYSATVNALRTDV